MTRIEGSKKEDAEVGGRRRNVGNKGAAQT